MRTTSHAHHAIQTYIYTGSGSQGRRPARVPKTRLIRCREIVISIQLGLDLDLGLERQKWQLRCQHGRVRHCRVDRVKRARRQTRGKGRGRRLARRAVRQARLATSAAAVAACPARAGIALGCTGAVSDWHC